jgi:hypothetical protein
MLEWSKYIAFVMISGFAEAIQDEKDPMLPTSHDQEVDISTESGEKMLYQSNNKMNILSS